MSKESVHEDKDEEANLADKFDPDELLQMVSAGNLSSNINDNSDYYSNDDSGTMTRYDVRQRRNGNRLKDVRSNGYWGSYYRSEVMRM
jgi:hypothetical protein